jgi:prophage antirepressor-like protein
VLKYAPGGIAARINAYVPEAMRGVTNIITYDGSQEVGYFNEQGLNSFLGHSRKPKTPAFTDWIETEVLPALRSSKSERHERQVKYESTGQGDVNKPELLKDGGPDVMQKMSTTPENDYDPNRQPVDPGREEEVLQFTCAEFGTIRVLKDEDGSPLIVGKDVLVALQRIKVKYLLHMNTNK